MPLLWVNRVQISGRKSPVWQRVGWKKAINCWWTSGKATSWTGPTGRGYFSKIKDHIVVNACILGRVLRSSCRNGSCGHHAGIGSVKHH